MTRLEASIERAAAELRRQGVEGNQSNVLSVFRALARDAGASAFFGCRIKPDNWEQEAVIVPDALGQPKLAGFHAGYVIDRLEITSRTFQFQRRCVRDRGEYEYARALRVRVHFATEGEIEGGSCAAWLS